jgi:uncharacterized protein YybS (DUF2232 family)
MAVGRYIPESLVAALAAAVLFVFGLTSPLVGPLAGFFAPAAIIWVTCRHDPAHAFVAVVFATGLVIPFVPLPAAISFAIGNALLGWMLGLFLQHGKGIIAASITAAATVMVLSLIASAGHLWAAGLDVAVFLKYQLNDLIREIRTALEQVSQQAPPSADGGTEGILQFFTLAFPAIIYVTVVLEGMANSYVVLLVLSRKAPSSFAVPSLFRFSLPDLLVWPLIAALGTLLLPASGFRTAALNATVVLLFLFLLQGISITFHFFQRWRTARTVRMIFLIAVLLQPLMLTFPLLAGLLDFRFKFRERWPLTPPTAPEEETSS